MPRSRRGLRYVRGWLLRRAPRGQREGWLVSVRFPSFESPWGARVRWHVFDRGGGG